MTRSPLRDGDEMDVHSRWRRLITRYRRPGTAARVKRRTRRRERREGKTATRREAQS